MYNMYTVLHFVLMSHAYLHPSTPQAHKAGNILVGKAWRTRPLVLPGGRGNRYSLAGWFSPSWCHLLVAHGGDAQCRGAGRAIVPACGAKRAPSMLCTQRAMGWERLQQLGSPALFCLGSGPLIARHSRQSYAAQGRRRGATAAGRRPHSKWRRCGALPAGEMAADSRRSLL